MKDKLITAENVIDVIKSLVQRTLFNDSFLFVQYIK